MQNTYFDQFSGTLHPRVYEPKVDELLKTLVESTQNLIDKFIMVSRKVVPMTPLVFQAQAAIDVFVTPYLPKLIQHHSCKPYIIRHY